MGDEKREFLKQYVLNRALAMDAPLDAHAAAKGALEAWKFIESATPATPATRTTGDDNDR